MIKMLLKKPKTLLILFFIVISVALKIVSIYLQLKAAEILIRNEFQTLNFFLFQLGSLFFLIIGEILAIMVDIMLIGQKNNLIIENRLIIFNYFKKISFKQFEQKNKTEYIYDLENNLIEYFDGFITNFYKFIEIILLLTSLLIFIIVQAFLITFWIFIVFAFVILSVFLFSIIPLISEKILAKNKKNWIKIRNKNLGFATDFLNNFHFFFWASKINSFTKNVSQKLIKIETENLKLNKKSFFFDELELFSSDFTNQLALIAASFIIILNPLNSIFIIIVQSIFKSFDSNGKYAIWILKNSKIIKPKFDKLQEYYKKEKDLYIELNKPIFKIDFKNISFSYQENQIFNKFNYVFEKAKKYAIIGASGVGKSTIIKLMLKEEIVNHGKVFLNNYSINEINQKSILNQIYLVNNKFINVDNDLIKNITLFEAKIDREKLDTGCKLAEVNFDLKQPWNKLSDGQKQRIEIARALYFQKAIIVFDEALAHIDKKTAIIIENNLLNIKNLLFIHISHHFDNLQLKKYDKVLDLNLNLKIS